MHLPRPIFFYGGYAKGDAGTGIMFFPWGNYRIIAVDNERRSFAGDPVFMMKTSLTNQIRQQYLIVFTQVS